MSCPWAVQGWFTLLPKGVLAPPEEPSHFPMDLGHPSLWTVHLLHPMSVARTPPPVARLSIALQPPLGRPAAFGRHELPFGGPRPLQDPRPEPRQRPGPLPCPAPNQDPSGGACFASSSQHHAFGLLFSDMEWNTWGAPGTPDLKISFSHQLCRSLSQGTDQVRAQVTCPYQRVRTERPAWLPAWVAPPGLRCLQPARSSWGTESHLPSEGQFGSRAQRTAWCEHSPWGCTGGHLPTWGSSFHGGRGLGQRVDTERSLWGAKGRGCPDTRCWPGQRAASSWRCPGGGWVTVVKDSRTPFSPTRGCLSGALTLEARTGSLDPLSATLDKAGLASGTAASRPRRPRLPSGGLRTHCRRRPPGLGGTLSLFRNPGTVLPTPSCHSHTCFERLGCSNTGVQQAHSCRWPVTGGAREGGGGGQRCAVGPWSRPPSPQPLGLRSCCPAAARPAAAPC